MSRKYSVNKYISEIADRLYANQTLCKYLYYDQSNPLDQPDISNTEVLYTDYENQRLMFNPFTRNIEDSRMSKLCVLLNNIESDRTGYFKQISLDCIIACHNELWTITVADQDIGVRPLLIWDELDATLGEYQTRGVGKDKFDYSSLIYFTDNYTGYKVCYRSISLPIRAE